MCSLFLSAKDVWFRNFVRCNNLDVLGTSRVLSLQATLSSSHFITENNSLWNVLPISLGKGSLI
jgi:hypothetical protein